LRPDNNLYWIKITFDRNSQNGTLTIPDPGGMMDMVPQSFKQEAWVTDTVKDLNVKQTWATVWNILDEETYLTLVNLLEKSNRRP